MEKAAFVYVTYIKTTPEKLWKALTEGDFTEKYWWGRRVESDWKAGSPIRYVYDGGKKLDIEGVVLRCEAPRVLSYTFTSECNSAKERPSRVTFEIEPHGETVKFTVTHDDFDAGSEVLKGVSNGWPAIVSCLKSILETGKPLVYGPWKGA